MILGLALASMAAILAAFFVSAQYGILVTLLTKPIIDATWASGFGGINLLRLLGVLFPLLVFVRSLGTGKSLTSVPLAWIWMLYVVYSLLSSIPLIFENNPMDYANRAFRILNGLVGYYMIQTYFSDKESFRKLLIIIILAGLFPILMGVYQAVTGVVWQERATVGLIRNVGLYHDSAVFRQLSFQTLTGIMLYWAYFLPNESRILIKKILLLVFAVAVAVVLMKTYSKAGYLSVAIWAIIWSVGRRRYMPVILLLCGLISVNIIYKDRIWTDTQQLFSKEITAIETGAQSTERERKRTLAGRWYLWEEMIDHYNEQSALRQIFGGSKFTAAHNDYLDKLLTSGLVGVSIYVLLLTLIGLKIFGNYKREKSPLNVMAAMVFAMWCVDTIGLVPSLYPAYQWYVWGIIGLSFKGVDWGDEKPPLLDERPMQHSDNILARKKFRMGK